MDEDIKYFRDKLETACGLPKGFLCSYSSGCVEDEIRFAKYIKNFKIF